MAWDRVVKSYISNGDNTYSPLATLTGDAASIVWRWDIRGGPVGGSITFAREFGDVAGIGGANLIVIYDDAAYVSEVESTLDASAIPNFRTQRFVAMGIPGEIETSESGGLVVPLDGPLTHWGVFKPSLEMTGAYDLTEIVEEIFAQNEDALLPLVFDSDNSEATGITIDDPVIDGTKSLTQILNDFAEFAGGWSYGIPSVRTKGVVAADRICSFPINWFSPGKTLRGTYGTDERSSLSQKIDLNLVVNEVRLEHLRPSGNKAVAVAENQGSKDLYGLRPRTYEWLSSRLTEADADAIAAKILSRTALPAFPIVFDLEKDDGGDLITANSESVRVRDQNGILISNGAEFPVQWVMAVLDESIDMTIGAGDLSPTLPTTSEKRRDKARALRHVYDPLADAAYRTLLTSVTNVSREQAATEATWKAYSGA